MFVIPAVDIRGGSCVRLLRGDPEQETVYSSDPVKTARDWAAQGATRIHVIDLDGAFGGRAVHLDLAGRMKKETRCQIQFGGGIRDEETVKKALDLGIDKLILGTSALADPSWVESAISKDPERWIVSLDCRDGRVAVKGWKEGTSVTLDQALDKMEAIGFKETVYTDIGRDGTLEGPNLDSVRGVVSKTRMKVFASGGVSGLEDVKALQAIPGLAGVVIGKALYAGKVSLEDCLRLAR